MNLPATITPAAPARQAVTAGRPEPVPVVTAVVATTGVTMSMTEAVLRVGARIGLAAGTYAAGIATAAYALSHR